MSNQTVKALKESVKSSAFSGIVHISKDQTTIFHEVSGIADLVLNRPNTDGMAFGIASGTKFLTALAIGKLIDKGLLSLDTKINRIVSAIRGLYDSSITIRHLLSHTSGMPDYFDKDAHPDFDNVILPVSNDKLLSPSGLHPDVSKRAHETSCRRALHL